MPKPWSKSRHAARRKGPPSPARLSLVRSAGSRSMARNYYSQNAHGVSIPRPPSVNVVAPTHMEGGAFSSAIQSGESAYEATLYTDRAMCGYCWTSVRGYMRALGIRYLRVVEPNGVSYTIRAQP